MKASDSTPAKGESASGVSSELTELSTFDVDVDVEVPREIVEAARERRQAAGEGDGEAGALADYLLDYIDLRFRFLDENGEALKVGALDGGATTE
jgi:hypothetical protein